jgi:hypothetical protein
MGHCVDRQAILDILLNNSRHGHKAGWGPEAMIDGVRQWIRAAEAVRVTCLNSPQFDLLIRNQKQRLQRLAFATYRKEYSIKPMRIAANNNDELIRMPPDQGVHELLLPPATQSEFPRAPSPPRTQQAARDARHLWVIRSDDVPVALEACVWGKALKSGCIKHSNLTGGDKAHSGGEIWFIGDDRIAVNASSGRYGAESDGEFSVIVDALRRSGYHVASMGFDLDNVTIANTVFVGEPEWESPL